MRTTFDRRRFLLLGAGGAAAAIAGTGSAGAADPEHATVWRLSADWGYPVPPKNRTRCVCNACRAHAANKLYLTRDAAIAGRIHACCVCQPYSIQLMSADVAALAALTTAGSADLRRGPVRTAFEDAVARAQEPPPPPTTSPSPSPTTVPASTVPGDVDASSWHSDDELPTHAVLASGQLPSTGSDAAKVGALATAAVVAGAAVVGLARRPASRGSTDETI